MNTKIKHVNSSGNLYTDLGFTNSEERLAKAKLAMGIEKIIEKRNLKQAEAAEILGINQPKISALMNGKLNGFSIERLIHYLNLLNQDVLITVKHNTSRRKTSGHLVVNFF